MQTIFRHIDYLQSCGAQCDVCPTGDIGRSFVQLNRRVSRYYGLKDVRLVDVTHLGESEPYDMAIATMHTTVSYAIAVPSRTKAYFIQDFEPWFYPMGNEYLSALSTYNEQLTPIVIGRWLAARMHDDFGHQAFVTDFCADQDIYRPLANAPVERAVCAIWQPEKPRRCAALVEETFALLHELRPDLRLYLYGSRERCAKLHGVAQNLGLLSKEECNELYNKCLAGLCISSSNPSRIPFEMMAAGLPVVDIHAQNNLFDFCDESALLARPTPDALAEAIVRFADDDGRRIAASERGIAYMRERPACLEQEQFAQAVCQILGGSSVARRDVPAPLYTNAALVGTSETRDAYLARMRKEREERARTIESRWAQIVLDVQDETTTCENWRAYVWHDAKQRDMQCYEFTRGADGLLRATIDVQNHESQDGEYLIHVYADLLGQSHLVTALSCVFVGEQSDVSEVSYEEPATDGPALPFVKARVEPASEPAKTNGTPNQESRPQGVRSSLRRLLHRR
ncbi:MAG: GBS Bsp-like repeat-containing protein [Atopobiaceae bacterium]|nr:GBS Bsp-like repeat-containing protein [Atopobiaceae bacterium]